MDADVAYPGDEDYMGGYYGDELDLEGYLENGMYGYMDGMEEPEDVHMYARISPLDLLTQCMIPTVSQAWDTTLPLLGLCFVFKVSCTFGTSILGFIAENGVPKRLFHAISSTCGLIALHLFFQQHLVYLVMLGLLSYLLMVLMHWKCRGVVGISVSFVAVVYLLTCELMVVKATDWHKIRGSQMVLAMKVISLAFDLDGGHVTDLPDIWTYAGYVFHVGSVIFGPWIRFQDYVNTLHHRDKLVDIYWILKLVRSSVLSVVCILMSTCIVHWLFIDDSDSWILAYRDAQSFRFSHYFVSYLSEVTLTLSGLGATVVEGDVRWDHSVARPSHIEIPRSLVEVVTNWNLPMHFWLKTYVFKTARPLGNFCAIILTYAASSLLHGLNFQLAAVLLSLGFFTYIEYVLRARLSTIFSACVHARKCKPECQHTHKSSHTLVRAVNFVFGLVSVYHLAYLGVMFDSSPQEEKGYTMQHTLDKWSKLAYASHWVALGTYIFYWLI